METGRTMVGRSYKGGGAWVSLTLALILLPLGGALMPTDMILGIVFTSAGGVLLLTASGIFLWIKAGRAWLTLHEAGFCIEDCAGLHEFRDEDVEGIALSYEVLLSNGTPAGSRFRLQLWMTGSVNPYLLVHSVKLNQTSPIEELSDRCHKKLHLRTQSLLEQSGALEGAGWRIDRQQFHIPDPLRPESYRWDEFSAVEIFDNHVCLWLKGEQEPKFRFHIFSKNARLLATLAQERLPKTPKGAAPDVEGLGRILFQRGGSYGVIAGVGAAVVLFGLAVAIGGQWACGAIVIAGGVGVLLWAWAARNVRFRCHERGVCLAKWIENREIRFDEVSVFTYGATRRYHDGLYCGTAYVFDFLPLPDTGKKSIHYTTIINGSDEEMDHLRDHIAKVTAMRMARDRAAGQSVQWTPNLLFLPDSLEFKPAGFIGRKAPITIPYNTVRSANINEGTFHIWVKDKEKSVVQEVVSQPNFFPGYFLFVSMFSPAGSQTPDSPKPSDVPAEPASDASANAN